MKKDASKKSSSDNSKLGAGDGALSERELLLRLDKKLDILLSKFGAYLGPDGNEQRYMTAREREENVRNCVEDWRRRRALRTMKLIDSRTGQMRCQVCGAEHYQTEFKPHSFKKFHCKNGCSLPGETL
jgi:hypothetical protein